MLAVVLAISAASLSVSAKQQRPKLVVILVVDQMRADYVERFSSTWHGGLHRLITEGARFTNAFYPYANTVTCAGHSTISTGDLPSTHGMIANDWYERDTNSRVTCVNGPEGDADSVRRWNARDQRQGRERLEDVGAVCGGTDS